jgi:hypothetical protein
VTVECRAKASSSSIGRLLLNGVLQRLDHSVNPEESAWNSSLVLTSTFIEVALGYLHHDYSRQRYLNDNGLHQPGNQEKIREKRGY